MKRFARLLLGSFDRINALDLRPLRDDLWSDWAWVD
jgi:hypothetical protein